MENTNTYDSVVSQQTFANHTGNMMVQSSLAYDPTQSDRAALRTFYTDYGCRPDIFMRDVAATSPRAGDFRGFYPSSQFVCPAAGPFPDVVPPTLVNTYNDRNLSFQRYRSGLQPPPCGPFPAPRQSRQWGEGREQSRGAPARSESEAAVQSKRDSQWLRSFSRNRSKPTNKTPQKRRTVKADLRPVLCRVARLLTQLDELCNTLRSNIGDGDVCAASSAVASKLKKEVEDQFAIIDSGDLDAWRSKLRHNAERRTRKKQQDAEKRRQERISEKEAAIDAWRLRQIRGVEEKKKERELKLVADAVLCEVRKKQADVKRMQDILRSLHKLHKLRKEAALRKGIVIEKKCEEAFSGRLDQLSSVMKVRTSVYAAEEKALKVMLEGEHEEERRREREKQLKKEKEKLLLTKHMVDAVLFGELTADAVPQPFIHYYTQAELSVSALLQIRSEWDMFVVSANHPDGSSLPQNWVMPDQPSDEAWASALHPLGSG